MCAQHRKPTRPSSEGSRFRLTIHRWPQALLEGEEAALLQAWPRLAGRGSATCAGACASASGEVRGSRYADERSGCLDETVRLREGTTDESPEPLRPGQVVLLDTIGELASVYSLAAVALSAAAFVPAGGHNPLEPAQFGVPIVMGPHYANFRAITEDLLAHDAVRIAEKRIWLRS